MPTDYHQLLGILDCGDGDVHSLFRSGSRVYGCARVNSDEDFVAVLSKRDAKQDLVFRPNINIIVHTVASFQEALDNHNVLALECLFARPEAKLKEGHPPFPFTLKVGKLSEQACEKSLSDCKKAQKLFAEAPGVGRKKLYHSIRVLMFARQIIGNGRIVDYGEANEIWEDIETRGDAWESYSDLVRLRADLHLEIG